MNIIKIASINWFAIVAISLRLASGTTANFSYLLVAIYALFGRKQALIALTLSWLFTFVNPGLAPEASMASVLRYIILLCAAISVYTRVNIKQISQVKGELFVATLFGIFVLVHSVIFSSYVDVSMLKGATWTVAMTTTLCAWAGLSQQQRKRLADNFYHGLVAVALVSVPFLGVHSIGYLQNGRGFQGVLGHPQSFGVVMAIIAAMSIGRLLVEKTPKVADLLIFVLLMVFVILSQSRTAGFSLFLGIPIAVVVLKLNVERKLSKLLPGIFDVRVRLIVFASLMAAIVYWPKITNEADSFVDKRGDSSNIQQAYEGSRGFLADRMWVNIRAKPWQGIGFGVASVPGIMKIKRDSFFGLPKGAPIEKGILPLAVVEELGIFGACIFGFLVFLYIKRSAKCGFDSVATVITIFLTNMGEYTFFSAGGLGLFSMIFLSWAITDSVDNAVASHELKIPISGQN